MLWTIDFGGNVLLNSYQKLITNILRWPRVRQCVVLPRIKCKAITLGTEVKPSFLRCPYSSRGLVLNTLLDFRFEFSPPGGTREGKVTREVRPAHGLVLNTISLGVRPRQEVRRPRVGAEHTISLGVRPPRARPIPGEERK